MIDISSIKADDRSTHKVYVAGGLDENGEELADSVGFVIVGPHSAEFRKAQAKLGAKVIALKREEKAEKSSVDQMSPEELYEINNEGINTRAKIVAECCTVDLFGFSDKGQPLQFSANLLEQILIARPLWAYMVMRAVETEALFTKG